MATGASTADLAVILADVHRSGDPLVQTRRHTYICHLLGVRRLVLAVNKLDLVGYDQAVFDAYVAKYLAFARNLGVTDVQCIPVSALRGDNVVARSANMPWYTGPALLEYLEAVDVVPEGAQRPFRMPVQWVNRPDRRLPRFRRHAGQRHDPAGRPHPGAAVGPGGRGFAHRHPRRRPA